MADTIFDAVVVGGGPAGYTCAIRASQLGLKVALVDANDRLGGTCLLWGCIPTKAMLFTAEIWDHLKHAEKFGIDVTEPKLNWKNVLARNDDVITRHTKGLDFLMKKNKITTFKGFGKLTGPAQDGVHTIDVKLADGKAQTVKAKKVVLATGSDARMLPGYKADETILTNYEILKIAEMPKSLVVIGSGAVGVEFASIFKSFGADVIVLEMLPRVVPVEDEEISKELLRLFKKRGIDVSLSVKDTKIELNEVGGVVVSWTDANGKPQSKQADKVLVAVGRSPRTADIGLDKTNIKPDRGFIMTNEWMETTEPGVYAIGDIVGGMPQLAHVGSMAGLVVAARMAGKYAKPVNRQRIPGCTYTDPQIASVGLTETQAKEKGFQVKTGKFPFVGNSKATILDAHDGFVKVVSDAKYGEILGVHIIGPEGFELIAEAVAAMEAEATVEVMMQTIHAHPTLYEALGEAFNAVYGLSINA